MTTEAGTTGAHTLQVRPSTAAYKKFVKGGGPVALILLVYVGTRVLAENSSTGRWIYLALILLTFGVVALVMFSYFKTARVTVAGGQVESVGFFGRKRRFSISEVGRSLEVAGYDNQGGMRPPVPFLVLLDTAGKRLLRLGGGMWAPEDLARVSQAMHAPVDKLGTVKPKQLRATYPNSASTFEAHPFLWAIGAFVGLFVVLVIVMAATQ